ncbi:MAG: hypothetical protein RL538_786 [Candidatus Parcubacteria bacterium]|jgi:hypothetical protein
MNLFTWLYRLVFFDAITWPASSVYVSPANGVESKELLYQDELETLMTYLRLQLLDSVTCIFLNDAKVSIRNDEEVVATVTVLPKGSRRGDVFVLIELSSERANLKVWFQLAFLGFRVRFRKPTLYPVEVRTSVPRGP